MTIPPSMTSHTSKIKTLRNTVEFYEMQSNLTE